MKYFILFIAFIIISISGEAAISVSNFNDIDVVDFKNVAHLFTQDSSEVVISDTIVDGVKKVKLKRGKAIIFCVLTGFLGGHRIYLGTHQRTPIIYSITLGGLGILPLVDLIHLIFTKDISKFQNKSEIIMWSK